MKHAEYSAARISEHVGGTLHGDGTVLVRGVRPLESAGAEHLSFLAPTSNHTRSHLEQTARRSSAGALLVKTFDPLIRSTQIETANPLRAFMAVSSLFYEPPRCHGISPLASVAESALLGHNVAVGAFAVIGEGARIGDETVIHPHAVIYPFASIGPRSVVHAGAIIREYVELGEDCLIQNNAVIGSDGFGYVPDPELGHRRIPHTGTVRCGPRVDVGANAAIDRATFGETTIGEATKIDNLVMIGHNNTIGQRALICGQAGIAGSCRIGDDVILGGATGISDHLSFGDRSRAAARSGITGSVGADTDVGGYPHEPVLRWRRQTAALRRLPALNRELRVLRARVADLERAAAHAPVTSNGESNDAS